MKENNRPSAVVNIRASGINSRKNIGGADFKI
jgi:hypothetical protein